ncbi:transmembrane 4 L6 family member 20 [Monodelphis domestica]|uniref:Transmembrane 4 L six family member 20 n=1 Tax=Monodelphis domestica TaxID=13616 RepID=F6UGK4_MONDO|nr:transmembrane 4 L6 family member 20 [Monodelphis domestica]
MTCYDGWTSCNGFSLLVLLILAIALNIIPLAVYTVERNEKFRNPISCFEWFFPGVIGAGLLAIPATVMTLSARKRNCCNNRFGMFLSSVLSLVTIGGAFYCMLTSLMALSEGPLICNYHGNSTVQCDLSMAMKNISNIRNQFDLQWFYFPTCQPGYRNSSAIDFNTNSFQSKGFTFSSEENRHRVIHFTVFAGLFLVAVLEIFFSFSQIVIGLYGCLLGVSKKEKW